jgi:hypothetical protein
VLRPGAIRWACCSLAGLALILGLSATRIANGQAGSSAGPAGYLPWYSSVPSPLPDAYVSIGGAWGAPNIYNTHFSTNYPPEVPGTGMLNTGRCSFICFGAPGVESHHYVAYGNDVDPGGSSDAHLGAPDDCGSLCPGGVPNNVFSITVDFSPTPSPGPFFVSQDGAGDLAVLGNLSSAQAVVAGAGSGLAAPSPSPGSLVSHGAPGKGNVVLGNASTYVSCDYGGTSAGNLTCSQSFNIMLGSESAGFASSGAAWAMGGVRPNSGSSGGSGGYVPEAFPDGLPTPHPQILSGSCTVLGSGSCGFPNGFAFADTTYNCTVSAQGLTPLSDSYAKSTTSITIHSGALLTTTFSYICVR